MAERHDTTEWITEAPRLDGAGAGEPVPKTDGDAEFLARLEAALEDMRATVARNADGLTPLPPDDSPALAVGAPRPPRRRQAALPADGPPNRLNWSDVATRQRPRSPEKGGVHVFDQTPPPVTETRGMVGRIAAVAAAIAAAGAIAALLVGTDWSSATSSEAGRVLVAGLDRVWSGGSGETRAAASTAAAPNESVVSREGPRVAALTPREPQPAPAAALAVAPPPVPAASPSPPAAQAPPPTAALAPPAPAAQPEAAPAAAVPAAVQAAAPRRADTLSAAEIEAALVRGQDLLRQGDVASARLMFTHAASGSSDPRVLMALGSTFDPVVLRRLGVKGLQADSDRARTYYEQAARTGFRGAERALAALDAGDLMTTVEPTSR